MWSPPSAWMGEDTENFKDVDLMLFDKVIAFDNFQQKIILIVNMSLQTWRRTITRRCWSWNI